MKVGPVSGDTLLLVILGFAGLLALKYGVSKATESLSEFSDNVAEYAKEAMDSVVEAPAKVMTGVVDVVKPLNERATYEDNPVMSGIFDANELLKSSPFNPWNWPDYWKKLYN